MKNTHHTIALGLMMMTLASAPVFAQSYPGWSKPEQLLADILLRDTTSRTVSYLPKGYWFGLSDRSHGYLKLVKNGKNNYLLRDGTHQVFLLNEIKGKPSLQRLDSSVFYGDNFLSMTFLRKDTIYQYGGYGFWNTRDFFMYYRNTNKDWEFLTGGDGLPNELNYYWYDKTEDAFYIMGSLSSTHHPIPQKKLVDSIYRYDFVTHQWTSIGRIQDNFSELDLLWKLELPVCFTSFGFLDTRSFQLKLYDIPGNRILIPKGRLTDFLFRIAKGNPLQINEYKHFIYLGDSLHVLQGNRDTILHATIQITEADFDASKAQILFIPNKKGFRVTFTQYLAWIISLTILLMMAGFFWKVRRRRIKKPDNLQAADSSAIERSDEITPTYHPAMPTANIGKLGNQDLDFFRAALNPTEQELLDMLLKATLSGTAADIISINKTLGVSNKEASLQKTRRSICINNINSCFRQTLKIDENLIIRERDSEDKRAFVYKLDARYVDLLKG
jgi:hypothetical protein